MEDIRKPKRYYFKDEGFTEAQYAGAMPFIKYSSYVDLKQSKSNIITDHKAVVETLQNDLLEANIDYTKSLEELQKRIEELEDERDITRCANISACSYYISVEDNKV